MSNTIITRHRFKIRSKLSEHEETITFQWKKTHYFFAVANFCRFCPM